MQRNQTIDSSREVFNALRDQLAENTLVYFEHKPLTKEAWLGVTRGVEFTRQCRNLHDFDCKWMRRQQQGLGLADYWSDYAAGKPRPNQLTEADTVMLIYRCQLYAAGAEQDYTKFEKEFASFAITEAAIRKAKKNATPRTP